jgi:hypothetical protein
MKTLLLSAPRDKDSATGLHRSFSTILNSKVGPDYAIYGSLVSRITPGMRVVVFERVDQKQAEGTIAAVIPTGNITKNGIRRYDIKIPDLHPVQYGYPPHVNHCGVAIV